MTRFLAIIAIVWVSFAAVGQNVQSVSTLTNLVARTPNTGERVQVLGYRSPGDWGAPRMARHVAGDTTTTNRGNVFRSSDGSRYLFDDRTDTRQDIRWFGAVGDGATDDTAAIQAALDHARDYGAVVFPSGTNLITSQLYVSNKVVGLIGQGSPKPVLQLSTNWSGTNVYLLRLTNQSTNKQGFAVRGLEFNGSGVGPLLYTSALGTVIEDTDFRNPWPVSLYADTYGLAYGWVARCRFTDYYGDSNARPAGNGSGGAIGIILRGTYGAHSIVNCTFGLGNSAASVGVWQRDSINSVSIQGGRFENTHTAIRMDKGTFGLSVGQQSYFENCNPFDFGSYGSGDPPAVVSVDGNTFAFGQGGQPAVFDLVDSVSLRGNRWGVEPTFTTNFVSGTIHGDRFDYGAPVVSCDPKRLLWLTNPNRTFGQPQIALGADRITSTTAFNAALGGLYVANRVALGGEAYDSNTKLWIASTSGASTPSQIKVTETVAGTNHLTFGLSGHTASIQSDGDGTNSVVAIQPDGGLTTIDGGVVRVAKAGSTGVLTVTGQATVNTAPNLSTSAYDLLINAGLYSAGGRIDMAGESSLGVGEKLSIFAPNSNSWPRQFRIIPEARDTNANLTIGANSNGVAMVNFDSGATNHGHLQIQPFGGMLSTAASTTISNALTVTGPITFGGSTLSNWPSGGGGGTTYTAGTGIGISGSVISATPWLNVGTFGISNWTTAANTAQWTIPASYISADGQTVRGRIIADVLNNTGSTVQYAVYLVVNGTTAADPNAASSFTTSSGRRKLEVDFTLGRSTSALAHGFVSYRATAAGESGYSVGAAGDTAVNTFGFRAFPVTWSATNLVQLRISSGTASTNFWIWGTYEFQ